MSINSQYMVLFKNPRDQVGPSVFARQMYPNNPKKFMNKYAEGTKRPHGYLFIDLKQNTPEDLRLRTDVFDDFSENHTTYFSPIMVEGAVKQYKSGDIQNTSQLNVKHQSEQTCPKVSNNINFDEKMPSCEDCGIMFENVHDLARHINRWCPENNLKRKHEDDDDEANKIPKLEIEDNDDVAFQKLAKMARDANEEKWKSKVDRYVEKGLDGNEARKTADRKLKDDDMYEFTSRYEQILQYLLQLRNNKLHEKVMEKVDNMLYEGMDYQKAIKIATRKYKHVLEGYLDAVIADEEYEDSDGEEDSETEGENSEDDEDDDQE